MIDVLRIAHLRIAPQEGNLEVGNCEGNQEIKLCIIIESPAGIGPLFAGFCSQAKWTPRLSWVPMYPLIPS